MSLAIVLKDQGKLAGAETAFRRVAELLPNLGGAHKDLGNILAAQGKLADAEVAYRRALTLQPNMVDAINNLGLIIVQRGGSPERMPWFRRHAEFVYGTPGNPGGQAPSPHKVLHDQEQRDYLKGSGAATPSFHLDEGARMNGRALNPDPSNGSIGEKWKNTSPQIAVLDNLLTDEALGRIRQFGYRSTVWHKSYQNGYIGDVQNASQSFCVGYSILRTPVFHRVHAHDRGRPR